MGGRRLLATTWIAQDLAKTAGYGQEGPACAPGTCQGNPRHQRRRIVTSLLHLSHRGPPDAAAAMLVGATTYSKQASRRARSWPRDSPRISSGNIGPDCMPTTFVVRNSLHRCCECNRPLVPRGTAESGWGLIAPRSNSPVPVSLSRLSGVPLTRCFGTIDRKLLEQVSQPQETGAGHRLPGWASCLPSKASSAHFAHIRSLLPRGTWTRGETGLCFPDVAGGHNTNTAANLSLLQGSAPPETRTNEQLEAATAELHGLPATNYLVRSTAVKLTQWQLLSAWMRPSQTGAFPGPESKNGRRNELKQMAYQVSGPQTNNRYQRPNGAMYPGMPARPVSVRSTV